MNQTNIEAQMKALHQDMKTLKEKASRFSTIRFLLVNWCYIFYLSGRIK